MTTYEIIMIMLTCLTLVVRLLLLIIDKNVKKKLPHSLVKFEVVIFSFKIQGQPLTGCSFFVFIIVYAQIKVNICELWLIERSSAL